MKLPIWTPSPEEEPDSQRAIGFYRSQVVYFALLPWVITLLLVLFVGMLIDDQPFSQAWPALMMAAILFLAIRARVVYVRRRFGSLMR